MAPAGSAAGRIDRRASPGCSASPAALATATTMPATVAPTGCSIFMDSSTATVWPMPTHSPTATSIDTTAAANGAPTATGSSDASTPVTSRSG